MLLAATSANNLQPLQIIIFFESCHRGLHYNMHKPWDTELYLEEIIIILISTTCTADEIIIIISMACTHGRWPLWSIDGSRPISRKLLVVAACASIPLMTIMMTVTRTMTLMMMVMIMTLTMVYMVGYLRWQWVLISVLKKQNFTPDHITIWRR